MNSGMEALIKDIKLETGEKVESILAEADEEAKEIIKNAREEAKSRAKKLAEKRVSNLKRRILDRTELEGQNAIFRLKNDTLEEVRGKAREKLEAVVEGEDPTYEYTEILYNLIKEAVKAMKEQKLFISANSRDTSYLKEHKETIEQRLEKNLQTKVTLSFSEEEPDYMGGVKVENQKGSKTYYNTLEAQLANTYTQLKPKLNRMLFKKGGEKSE